MDRLPLLKLWCRACLIFGCHLFCFLHNLFHIGLSLTYRHRIPFFYFLMIINQTIIGLSVSFHHIWSLCSWSMLEFNFLYVVETHFSFLILLTADANSFAVQHSSFFNCCHHLHVSSASSELLWPRHDSQDDTFRVNRCFLHWECQRKFKVVRDVGTPYHIYSICYVLNFNSWFCLSSIRLCAHCIALYVICCSACVLLYFVSCQRCLHIMFFFYHLTIPLLIELNLFDFPFLTL